MYEFGVPQLIERKFNHCSAISLLQAPEDSNPRSSAAKNFAPLASFAGELPQKLNPTTPPQPSKPPSAPRLDFLALCRRLRPCRDVLRLSRLPSRPPA